MDAICFDIPAARLADATSRVAKYARKTAKFGMSAMYAPTMRVVCEYERVWLCRGSSIVSGPFTGFVPLLDDGELSERGLHREVLPMLTVEITGERPIINGWEFAATIEHTPEGNFVLGVPGSDIPREYRDAPRSWCDHCKTSRQRNHTYVVRSLESGDHKRVGRTCLQDFLGSASPEAWMHSLTFYSLFADFAEQGDNYGEDFGGGSYSPPVGVLLFVATVIAWARDFGYVSAKQAGGYDIPTGAAVLSALTIPKTRQDSLALAKPSDFAKAREALAWLAEQGDDTDYMYNLQLAAKQGEVTGRTKNFLASLVPSFDRELARRVKPVTLDAYYPAEIGERAIIDITITRMGGYESAYGYIHIVTMTSTEGHTLMWGTATPSRVEADEDGDFDLSIGDTFRMLGTVVEKSEYRGTKQTRLSRCKLYPAGSEAKPLATAARKLAKSRGVEAPQWSRTSAQKKKDAKKAALCKAC